MSACPSPPSCRYETDDSGDSDGSESEEVAVPTGQKKSRKELRAERLYMLSQLAQISADTAT
jgi:hypothetical protein